MLLPPSALDGFLRMIIFNYVVTALLLKVCNGRYHTMPSRVSALCSSKYVIWICENIKIMHQRGHPCPMDTLWLIFVIVFAIL